MQPTEIQVQRSLQALQQAESAHDSRAAAPDSPPDLPDGLVDFLNSAPAVRLERMADARMRLASGEVPSDDDLASRLVGRMVCDRLR